MGVFPSGQRGQTVNLLLIASVVRIHPLPPSGVDIYMSTPFVILQLFYVFYSHNKTVMTSFYYQKTIYTQITLFSSAVYAIYKILLQPTPNIRDNCSMFFLYWLLRIQHSNYFIFIYASFTCVNIFYQKSYCFTNTFLSSYQCIIWYVVR